MKSRKSIILKMTVVSLLLLVLLVVFTLFGGRREVNVLLITLDTTRADRIGVYGYTKGSTPNLDGLASGGVVFESAFSPVPLTLPSHSSILTGMAVPYHKVRNNGRYVLPGEVDTLAEILKRRKYTTAAFVSSFTLDSRFGTGQGFDVYSDGLEVRGENIKAYASERNAEAVYNDFAQWFERNKSKHFFSWVHFYDPHIHYKPPEPYLSRFKDNPYDGEIAYTDEYIGKIIRLLKSKGCLRNTLVVIVGDHGEAFGEHGEFGHQVFCYEENLKVPFICYGGGLPRQKRVKQRVEVTDVTPTILDYLGIPFGSDMQGVSLLPLIKGKESWERTFYIESVFPAEALGCSEVKGWVEKGYKYIDLPRPELYNLEADPLESNNLYFKEQRRARKMKGKIADYLEQFVPVRFSSTRKINAAEIKRLESLGYITSARPGSRPAAVPDPKDMIVAWTNYTRGEESMRHGDYEDAIRYFTQALDANPDFSWPYARLAFLYSNNGHHKEARRMFEKGVLVNPWDNVLALDYANYLVSQSEFYEAFTVLKKLEKSASIEVSAGVNLAIAKILTIREYFTDALPYYQKVLQVEPENLYIKKMVGFCLYKSQRLDEALAVYMELDTMAGDNPEVLFISAIISGQLEKNQLAEVYFDRLLKIEETPAIYYNFAMILSKLGKWQMAVEKLRRFDLLYTAKDRRKEEAQRLIRDWSKKYKIAPNP